MKQINMLGHTYAKSTMWSKVLLFTILLILLVYVFKDIKNLPKEGFEQSDQFLFKSGPDIYDAFYSDVYDYLVYNNVKNDYEIGEIVNKTIPSSKSIILDIGCGTGHHVSALKDKELDVIGIDISPSMVEKAKENYPNYTFKVADALNATEFESNSFTHILCLYFTIYYMKDKRQFFSNCMNWTMPGGYLIVHLVDRDNFDPILPPGNPLLLVSPQRYAKERITSTKVKFNDFAYSSNFELDREKNIAKFVEKFKNDKDGKIRKQEQLLYMTDIDDILANAQNAGFILHEKIDLIHVQYEYQYLYVFIKPN